MEGDQQVVGGGSPYATGGGGVQLEREFAASALACLLLEQPVPGLGDEFVPISVAMQQSALTAVDDVVIRGRSPNDERSLQVACRRSPTIGKSEKSTVKLFADYLQVVLADKEALAADRLRLGLAVSGPHTPSRELAILTDVARVQPSCLAFKAAIDAEGAYTAKIRERLGHVDGIVAEALTLLGRSGDADELSWELLRSLFVIDLRLEGDVAPGRTDLVARLQSLTGSPAAADLLRLQLVELASKGAIRAGAFTRGMVRDAVRTIGVLEGSPGFAVARPQLELLEEALRQRTQRALPARSGRPAFSLDRTALQNALVECIRAGAPGTVVIVRGEPDVGKSALALGAIDVIRGEAGAAIAMSLRDLPPAVRDLRTAMGLGPDELFEVAPSAPTALLLLDGVEAVQEQDGGVLAVFLKSAAAAGRTVVLVTRDDAVGTLRELIQPLGVGKPVEFPVPPLENGKIAELIAAIPELTRLSEDPRSVWLLRRLGLVELLLRSAEAGGILPATLSSEAEVFDAVWSGLIRQNERTVDGLYPDDREVALLVVARTLVTGAPGAAAPGQALARLRSDGVLLPLGKGAAWRTGETLASDVLRDFATARLLLVDGLATLTNSSAPRWAIRAARLYAQARLAAAVVTESVPQCWERLQQEFTLLAQAHGARWRELPWEALLTAGWADRALDALGDRLKANGALRAEAVRCLKLRMTSLDACDPLLGQPLVAWLVAQGYFEPGRFGSDKQVAALVLTWLRGVARAEGRGQDVSPFRAVRQQIRTRLAAKSRPYPDTLIEGLGLMGVDTDSATVALLGEVARGQPHVLADLVESADVAVALSRRDAGLLASLTAAYYIVEDPSQPELLGVYEDGIRHHDGGGAGMPLAAWYRGPFLSLLRANGRVGLDVINRMLEAGARTRGDTRRLSRSADEQTAPEGPTETLRLALLGHPERPLLGDSHVWLWYRGSGVGPYPCMSALFSLELYLDQLVTAGLGLGDLARWVLRDASTLATPALVYGFLVRHIDSVTDELDDFLAQPAVWQLEFRRTVAEGRLHVQGKDPKQLAGLTRRSWDPKSVAMYLVETARRRGDGAALARLKKVGERLIEAAGGGGAPAPVKMWAAHLDASRYVVESHDTHDVIEVRPSEDVRGALSDMNAASAVFGQMTRLMNRYRLRDLTPYRRAPAALPGEAELLSDIGAGQSLWSNREQTAIDPILLRPAVAGLAASLAGAATRGAQLQPDQIRWATDTLIDCVPVDGDDPIASEHSIHGDGADRRAALALPLVLSRAAAREGATSAEASASDDGDMLLKAIRTCTTTRIREVRERAGEGCGDAGELPCANMPTATCWHELLWDAIDAGVRAVMFDRRGLYGRLELVSLTGPLDRALAQAAPDRVMFNHFTPMVTCLLRVAQGGSCLAARARALREILLTTWAASAVWWAEQDYEWRDDQVAGLASSLLRTQAMDGFGWVEFVARGLQGSPGALAGYLKALAVAPAYEMDLVTVLQATWPECMRLGLDVLVDGRGLEDRFDAEHLVSNLVPVPQPSAFINGFDEVLLRARENWVEMSAVQEHIGMWLQEARKQRSGIDALVGFLETQPASVQLAPGLEWMREIVVMPDGSARASGFTLLSWLRGLHDRRALTTATWPHFRAIVDALVLSGYAGARQLQQRDE
jgi:hypothetical protein